MTSPVTSPMSRRRLPAVAALTLVALLALAGCSGASDSGADGGGSDAADAPAAGSEREFAETGSDPGSAADADTARDGAEAPMEESGDDAVLQSGSGGSTVMPVVQAERSVISTAVVSLRSDDAGATRTEVMKIVDVHRGQVSDEETQSDDDGAVRSSRLVLRIPAPDFAETVAQLEKVADLESSNKSSEDV
jgi:hypothetical protein